MTPAEIGAPSQNTCLQGPEGPIESWPSIALTELKKTAKVFNLTGSIESRRAISGGKLKQTGIHFIL